MKSIGIINIAAMRGSFTCIDNFRGGRQCVYLVVKVGVTGEAPYGQVGQ